MSEIALRQARQEDVEALASLGRESFCAAFAHLYPKKDLDEFLGSAYSEGVVAREIADEKFVHCLAEEEGLLLGFCKLCRPSVFAQHSNASRTISLNQLYTQPNLTGKGVGRILMDWAIAEARTHDCDAIQLSVWSENYRAHRFYERYGFVKIADIEFWVGSHRDDEFLFELMLAPEEVHDE